jgi:transposase-like protein
MEKPKTLLQAVRMFRDKSEASAFFASLRWPNGAACPRDGCGSMDVRSIGGDVPRWFCKDCKKEFTAKVGTIFEDSPIGFDKWLPAIWLLTSAKNGVSSCELARSLGVTQKTAWFMEHRIRLALKSGTFTQLRGRVESDETYIGSKGRDRFVPGDRHRRKSLGPHIGKRIVQGLAERKGEVRAFVVPDTKRSTLHGNIRKHVAPGSTVYTDALPSYSHMSDYEHEVINHAEAYVRGQVHTNHVENFWSVLKRTIAGTYVAPRIQHLDRYLDEQVFRFNSRQSDDGARFAAATKGADKKRLTYKALTGKG